MGSVPDNVSLTDQFADALPKDASFTFHHLSTPPTRCAAIFSAPPGAKPERTYCESHFLSMTIKPRDSQSQDKVAVFAIEVLVYTTKHLTTLFVSKADSTGYLSLLGLQRGQSSPLRSTVTTFVTYLARHRQRPGVRLVVSLFARAQDQYLFPGSVENRNKHVSDDRQLVKWWCRVLDPVLAECAAEDRDVEEGDSVWDDRTTVQGYLIVPGEDGIVQFLPPTVRSDPILRKRWKHGHPLRQITATPNAPPRCLIPHFPDDPKARFLSELDDDMPDVPAWQHTQSPPKRGTGQWRSVKTLEQFWDTMAFRQECSSGRLVGFIWIVFKPSNVKTIDGGLTHSQATFPSTRSPAQSSSGPRSRSQSPSRQRTKKSIPPENIPSVPPSQRRKLTGPIVPRLPRIKCGSSTLSTISQPEESKYYFWPRTSRAQLVLDEKDYKRANDLLLRLDFSTQTVAASSTRRWVHEVAVLAGLDGIDRDWGVSVVGRNALVAETNGDGVHATVSSLKRRADLADAPAYDDSDTGANVLPAGLVRKQPRLEGSCILLAAEDTGAGVNVPSSGVGREKANVELEPPSLSEAAPVVNVLGAGMVRKKQKG